MADSDITVTDLTGEHCSNLCQLEWRVTDPYARGLWYRMLDKVEVWASLLNDRATASRSPRGATPCTSTSTRKPFTTRSERATPPVSSASGTHQTQRTATGHDPEIGDEDDGLR
jgi:hypothetical protein